MISLLVLKQETGEFLVLDSGEYDELYKRKDVVNSIYGKRGTIKLINMSEDDYKKASQNISELSRKLSNYFISSDEKLESKDEDDEDVII